MPTEEEIFEKRLELIGRLFRDTHPGCAKVFDYEMNEHRSVDEARQQMTNRDLGAYLMEYLDVTFELFSERVDAALWDWMMETRAEADIDDKYNYLREGM